MTLSLEGSNGIDAAMTPSIEDKYNISDVNSDLALDDAGNENQNEEEGNVKGQKRQGLFSKTTTVALMGVTIGILFTIVVALVAKVSSTNKEMKKILDGPAYETTVLDDGKMVEVVYENVTVPPDDDEDGDDDEESSMGGDEEGWYDEEGYVKIPKKLNDVVKKFAFIKVGDRYQLNLPIDMIQRLEGRCAYWDEYTLNLNDNDPSNCGTSEEYPNFPYNEETAEKGLYGYTPSNETYAMWSKATQVSEDNLRNIMINSGVDNHKPGLLCSMPQPQNPDNPQPAAQKYWETCVQPRAGFLNTLECRGMCKNQSDATTCSTQVNLGFAMLEKGVCYPSHQHYAEEGYWQIAGRGWWRTWTDVKDHAVIGDKYVTTRNNMGSKYPLFVQRQNLPHEMDTTSYFDGIGNPSQENSNTPMVMVYYWGKSNALSNEYQFVPGLHDHDMFTQGGRGSGSCGTKRRIPDFKEGEEIVINTNNC